MEKFSLRWNDYQSNVSKSFQRLRHKEDFCDVTLVGDDYKQVTAHKVILSSCSEYFDHVLRNSKKHAHPLLCLQGVRFQDIQNILDFIYNGELKIHQEDIDRFLVIAQRLKLDGLNDGITEEKNAESFQDPPLYVEDKIYYKTPVLKERSIVPLSNGDFDTMEKLDQKVRESYSRDEDGLFSCHYCSRIFKNQSHIKEHVEIHFEGLSLKCKTCAKTYGTRNSLRAHARKCVPGSIHTEGILIV